MQNRVLGKIYQDAETVTYAAAEDDQIDRFFFGNPENFALFVAGLDPYRGARSGPALHKIKLIHYRRLRRVAATASSCHVERTRNIQPQFWNGNPLGTKSCTELKLDSSLSSE